MATRLKTKDEELDVFEGSRTQTAGQAWHAFLDAEQKSRQAEKNNPAFQSSKHLAKINGVLDVLKKHSGKNQLFELYDYYKNSRERGFTVIKTIFGFDRRTYNNQKMKLDLTQFGAELKNGVPCKKPGHLNLLIHIKL
jgi:hypothetical protein